MPVLLICRHFTLQILPTFVSRIFSTNCAPKFKILTRSIDSAVSSAGVPVPLTCGRVIFQQVRPLGRADRGEDSPFELAPGIKLPKLINRVM